MTLLYFGRASVIQIFSNDPEVQAASVDCFYLIVLCFFFDCLQGTLQGVIRALNYVKMASLIAVVAYFIVALPLACFLVFGVGMDVRGLWIGILTGSILHGLLYLRLVVWGVDW